MALLVYFITDPADGLCLPKGDNLDETNLISRSVLMLAVALQLFFNGGIWRLGISFCGILRRLARVMSKTRSENQDLKSTVARGSITSSVLHKFYDRWALFLCFDIALWTQPEYEDFTNVRIASLGMLACFLKAIAVLGFIQDCCVIFSGKFRGKTIKDSDFHSGASKFSEYWSNLWVLELALLISGGFFFAKMLDYAIRDLPFEESETNYSKLLLLAVNLFLLVSLVYFLRLVKTHEAEILSSSKILGGSNDTVVSTYLKVSLLFEVLKMLMFVQFCAVLVDGIPIIVWAFPDYSANPIPWTTLYLLGWSTPIFYGVLAEFMRVEVMGTTTARRYAVFAIYAVAHICCSIIGGFRGCGKLRVLENDGWMDVDDLNNWRSFLVYLAKANAIPTTLGFGLLFVTSPTAARYSASWATLPLVLQLILAPLPWLSPHLLNELHIASGAVMFTGGAWHAFSWMLIYALKSLTKTSVGVFFAVITGCVMLALIVKLLWPPGMKGLSYHYKWKNHSFDNFLKDSKYGSYHVYFANIVFLVYLFHGTVNLYPSEVYYWTFPLVCFLILFLLHPAKSTYYSTLLQLLRSRETFDRKYHLLKKTGARIKGKGLTDVRLEIQLPTYDHQFAEVIDRHAYTGYCDVILLKLRRPNTPIESEVETIHYYSVVNAVEIPRAHHPSIEVRLLIQFGGGMRKDGCSATLTNLDENVETMEVLSFLAVFFVLSHTFPFDFLV